jgi:hypothetical protein
MEPEVGLVRDGFGDTGGSIATMIVVLVAKTCYNITLTLIISYTHALYDYQQIPNMKLRCSRP